jgi:hypothetical protein
MEMSTSFDNTDMNADELIAEAKKHLSSIRPIGGDELSPANFPKAKVRETAMVCFESDVRTDRVHVFLDRESGEYITMMYTHRIGRPSKV